MEFSERLKELRTRKGFSQTQMAKDLDLALSTISMWESAHRRPPMEMLIKLAKYFDIPIDYLLGVENNSIGYYEEVIKFPVIAKVSAGYDHYITEVESGELQDVPKSVLAGRSKNEMLVFLVAGDSMAPKFLNGDRVLVSRQTSVDSGDIAIVSYNDHEDGTIKKVHYEVGCDYVDLIPLNPSYSPIRIQGEALQGVKILGKVVYLFRKI